MKYVLKELRRHKWRTIFSIAGYTFAAVFIFVILSITESNKAGSMGILQNTGTHMIVYIPVSESICTSSDAGGTVFAEGVHTMMLDNDLLLTVKNTTGVKDAAPCLLYKMYDKKFGSEISIAGIDTASLATGTNVCAAKNVTEGKYLSGKPDEVVAFESFAKAHDLSPGDTMNIFGSKLILAGIVNPGIRPVKADFYAPISLVRESLRDKMKCVAPGFDMNIILIEVDDSRQQDIVITKLKNMMYKFSVSSYNCYQPAYRVMSIIDRTSAGLTILIVIFLVIFSGKTQLTSLIERFREIGIMKSLGWSDLDLGTHIFLASFIQAITGVTLGLLAGIGLIALISNLQLPLYGNNELTPAFSVIPLIYALSLAGAFIAAIFPVIKIVRTSAGEIIKNYQ